MTKEEAVKKLREMYPDTMDISATESCYIMSDGTMRSMLWVNVRYKTAHGRDYAEAVEKMTAQWPTPSPESRHAEFEIIEGK